MTSSDSGASASASGQLLGNWDLGFSAGAVATSVGGALHRALAIRSVGRQSTAPIQGEQVVTLVNLSPSKLWFPRKRSKDAGFCSRSFHIYFAV